MTVINQFQMVLLDLQDLARTKGYAIEYNFGIGATEVSFIGYHIDFCFIKDVLRKIKERGFELWSGYVALIETPKGARVELSVTFAEKEESAGVVHGEAAEMTSFKELLKEVECEE